MEGWCGRRDSYVVSARDGETFGHHIRGGIETFLEPFISALASSRSAGLCALSGIARRFPSREMPVPSGSWSTTGSDLEEGIPWPLWDHPGNADHAAMWELVRVVLDAARRSGSARVADMADRMLYSCPFWWASEGRRDAEQVQRGIDLVIRTARAAADATGRDDIGHRVAGLVDRIGLVTGEGDRDAQEGTHIRGQTGA